MQALKIVNGDLVVGPHGYVMVEGRAKTLQDLSIAMREPFGSDVHHPQWGSLLSEFVGTPATPVARQAIQTEVIRIIKAYMAQQQARIQQDVQAGRRSSFSSEEIVNSIKSVLLAQTQDAFQVKVVLEMLTSDQTAIVQTVGA